ncbi:MAG: hypothetical protein ACREMB_12750, partial [Candidatus Rokuibacteriota bacterium]
MRLDAALTCSLCLHALCVGALGPLADAPAPDGLHAFLAADVVLASTAAGGHDPGDAGAVPSPVDAEAVAPD